MRPRSTLVLAIALLLAPSAASAQATRLDSLRAYAEGLGAFGFNGQLVVSSGDLVLVRGASGVADSTGRAITDSTCFAVGSITKSLTGAVMAQLAAEGKLSLGDPLARHVPGVPADRRTITLGQLLTHTSGLARDATDVRDEDDREQVERRILALPVTPDGRHRYSNAGYQLLAAVVERIEGRPFADVVRERLLEPAGMARSGTGVAAARACRESAVGRNEWRWLASLGDWNQRWFGTGAGDLVSNAEDLWRWARTLQGAGPLPMAELDTMLAPRARVRPGLHYGLGAYVVTSGTGEQFVSLGGNDPGYHAGVWIERGAPYRATVVTSTNERHGRGLAVTAIQTALWRILRGEPVSMPPVPVTWPADALDRLAGAWRLDDGGTVVLERDGHGLRLGLDGPAAMAVALGPDSAGARGFLDARAEQVLRAAADSTLAGALVPVERELWERPLLEGLAVFERRLGPLREVAIAGTAPLPWLANGARTYARLRFERGTVDASLAWLDRGLLDVAWGEGRPQPILLPVSPIAAGGLAAWDVLDGSSITLEPFEDARGLGLRVTSRFGQAIARR